MFVVDLKTAAMSEFGEAKAKTARSGSKAGTVRGLTAEKSHPRVKAIDLKLKG